MKKQIVIICSVFVAWNSAAFDLAASNDFRTAMGQLRARMPTACLKTPFMAEPEGFDRLVTNADYLVFAAFVTNSFDDVMTNLSVLTTSKWERLATLGACKSFDEDYYLTACGRLAEFKSQGALSLDDLEWALTSSRTNIDTCIVRRFREPIVTNLVGRLRGLWADDAYWDDVLSGAAYTNLMEELTLENSGE